MGKKFALITETKRFTFGAKISSLAISFALLVSAPAVTPSYASGTCNKVNAVKVVSGSKFVCKKVSGKLTWVKQGSSAVASPKPAAGPSTKPSPKPNVASEWQTCKTAGHSVLGQSGMLVCVKHNFKMVWVSYETLDSKEIGMPCRTAGQTGGLGGKLVKCEQYPGGKQWASTGMIDPAAGVSLASTGNFAGGCSLVASNPNAVSMKVVYSSTTNTNWCVAEVRSSTDLQLPSNFGLSQSRFTLTAVGGGGGGGPDGGAGGSGAEVRHMASILANASKPLSVTIGQGGEGGKWVSSVTTPGKDGSATTVSGLDITVVAAGGAGGRGWGARTPNQQNSWGLGLARFVGGHGGYDSLSATHSCDPIDWKEPIAGQDGPLISVAPGLTYQLAGGGGGGWSYTPRMALNYPGSIAGKGGGGAGASLIYNNAKLSGATAGKPGQANTGSGGGGGSACDIPGSGVNGVAQRTWGGAGGSGVVILSFELAKTTTFPSALTISRGTSKLPVIEIKGPFVGENTLASIRSVEGRLQGTFQVRSSFGRIYFDNLFAVTPISGGMTLVIEMPGYETLVVPVSVLG